MRRLMSYCWAAAAVGGWRRLLGVSRHRVAVSAFHQPSACRGGHCHHHHRRSVHLGVRLRPLSSHFPPSAVASVEDRIRELVSHPAVVWNASSTFASMHKKKLMVRHVPLFDRSDVESAGARDHLFDQFARAVCQAGCVARKEVFETWASALYIHSLFFTQEATDGMKPIRRVVDVAAGHGLLAWALLILDDEHRMIQGGGTPRPLTAFALDVQMPRSAELMHSSMIQQWPHLEERFDYVEGRLEQLVPHPSCLLASVHACGILSDILAATAAEHKVPLAVVPCCHSRKPKVLEVASPYARGMYEDIILGGGSVPDIADRLDEARAMALANAGLSVKEEFLPDLFTGKNRLIMGFPTKDAAKAVIVSQKHLQMRKGQMPPLSDTPSILPKSRFLKGFSVPCEDTKTTRQLVSKLAGRAAANDRKAISHNRNHAKSPQMDVSLWLPEEDVGLSAEDLGQLVKAEHNADCSVSKLGDVYIDPSGRKAQTFRFRYNNRQDEALFPFDDAKRIHNDLYELIPRAFPGAECR